MKENNSYAVPHTVYQQNYNQVPTVYAPYAGQGEPYPPQIKNVYSEKPTQMQEPYANAVYPIPPNNAVTLPTPHSSHVTVPPSNLNCTVLPKPEIVKYLPQNQAPTQENYIPTHDNVQKFSVTKNNAEIPNKLVPNNDGLLQKTPESYKTTEVTSSNNAVVATDMIVKSPPANQQNGGENVKVTNGVDPAPSRKSWASLFNKAQNSADHNVAESVIMNGCSKPLAAVSPFAADDVEEVSEEFLAMKEALRKKYDDPSFYRMGGMYYL